MTRRRALCPARSCRIALAAGLGGLLAVAAGAVEVRAGASGYVLAVQLGNPSNEATIDDAVLELAAQPPWLTGTAIAANGGPIAPGEERRVTISFGIAAGAPDGARGELVLRVAAEPGVFPDHSEIRVPLTVHAPQPPPPPPPPVASGYAVWLHPDDTTCCPGDTGGVPNYAFHGTPTDAVRAGAIVLRTFPDQAQMMAWVCSHEIVPHYWTGTYARLDGYHVTRVPCAVGAASPNPPPPPLPLLPPPTPPVVTEAPDPPPGGVTGGSAGAAEVGGWEPPQPVGGAPGETGSSGSSGWAPPVREEAALDPCRGPRIERRRALERLGGALERQDLDAVAATLGDLTPECPGDAADLARLRDAGVQIARAEADANAAQMRSAIARHNAAKQRSAQAWAAAAGVLQGVLTAIQSSATGSDGAIAPGPAGTGAGSNGGATTGGGSASSAPACYLNIPASVRGLDGKKGVRWYVVVQAGSTTAVSVVPAAEGQASPFGAGVQVSGPYGRLAEAESVGRARCPSSIASPFQ